MDVQIKDAAALGRVSPAMLQAYLQANGWVHEQTWRNRILVWSKSHNEQAKEILAPVREHSDAYALRISEAVALLSEIEGRSQLEIYYDLMATGADVIRLRPLNGAGQSGWSLGESADFLAHSRDLIMAAARAAERPGQPVYRGRASGEVTDYVRGVRPMPGYETGPALTLHSPVPAGYARQLDLGDSVRAPFPRRAVLALSSGLQGAKLTAETANAGGDISKALEENTPQGLSANLCDAVAALARRGNGVGVNLSWAILRPADAPDDEFPFTESAADVLADSAELLRQNSPFNDAHVTGEIVRLERPSREEFDGRSVVLYLLDGRPVGLRVQFDMADRDEVLAAFQDSSEISLDGDVHREGRQYVLKNPRNFRVVGKTA